MATQFIEVKKVIQNKTTGINTGTLNILLNIDDIRGGRPWHKKGNDVLIKGAMTQLILSDNRPENPESDKPARIRTLLIEEQYDDFKYRLAEKVPVKIMPKNDPAPALTGE